MVAESRKNLEDFCSEHGLSIAEATMTTRSAPDTAVAPEVPAPESRRLVRPSRWLPGRCRQLGVDRRTGSHGWRSRVIVLIVVAVLLSRSWPSRESSAVAQVSAAAVTTSASQAATPNVTVPAPAEPARPRKAGPLDADRGVATSARSVSTGGVSLITAQLCGTFSVSGRSWRCDPPADPVPLGSIVLYTRVKASRDATIEHRWYHDDVLRQAVRLAIAANASEGYRTYSRQTVSGAGTWRVEVRNASGDLLHEERFAVR